MTASGNHEIESCVADLPAFASYTVRNRAPFLQNEKDEKEGGACPGYCMPCALCCCSDRCCRFRLTGPLLDALRGERLGLAPLLLAQHRARPRHFPGVSIWRQWGQSAMTCQQHVPGSIVLLGHGVPGSRG